MGEREEGGEEEKTPVSKKHKKKVSFSFEGEGEGEGEVGVTPPSTKKQKKKVKKEREQQEEEEEEEGLVAVETPVKTEPEEMEVWNNGTTMVLELKVIPLFSIFNLRRACARVTVIVLCVCVCICLFPL